MRADDGPSVGALIAQAEGEPIQVSIRSRSGHVAPAVARALGGGGKPHAAGLRAEGSIDALVPELLSAVEQVARANLQIRSSAG